MTQLSSFLMAQLALGAAVAVCAGWDMRHRRIPNALTLGIAAAGVLLALVRPEITLAQSLAGLGIGLAIPVVLFALGLLGAGDAKLLGAIGAWMGPIGILWVLLITGLAGAVLSLGVAAWQRRTRPLLRNTAAIGMSLLVTRRTNWISAGDAARSEALQRTTLPYAVAILVGLLAGQSAMLLRLLGPM